MKSFFKTFVDVKVDDFVKNRKTPSFVIPAEAGIQSFQTVAGNLDSRLHRSYDLLRGHQKPKG